MALKRLTWNGNQYALRIRRHWNAFFALATVLEIKSLGIETLLPEGAGYHIIEIHDLCERALPHFDTFDNWWAFSCTLCDHYCDFYAMKRASPENPFNFANGRQAVQTLAKASRGYIGPAEWGLS